MNCTPVKVEEGLWECPRCSRRVPCKNGFHATCKPFTLKELWQTFRQARKRFKAAGSPRLDPIERLNICVKCSRYEKPLNLAKFARCNLCGCFVTLKAQWATEHCPRGLWPGDPEPKPCETCPK